MRFLDEKYYQRLLKNIARCSSADLLQLSRSKSSWRSVNYCHQFGTVSNKCW